MMAVTQSGAAIFPSVVILASSLALLAFFAVRFMRARLLSADASALQQLREDGILVGEPMRDYQTLSYLLQTVAPAVSMRGELWVEVYGGLLWATRLLRMRDWADSQLALLAAHQAERYQVALAKLSDLRANATSV